MMNPTHFCFYCNRHIKTEDYRAHLGDCDKKHGNQPEGIAPPSDAKEEGVVPPYTEQED